MELIASYPVTEDILRSHIGKRVYGHTLHGDQFSGVLHECRDGHIHMSPFSIDKTPLGVNKLKPKRKSKPTNQNRNKAKVSLFDGGPGYGGYGPGYGGYGAGYGTGYGTGFGAGLEFWLPLLLIGALFFI